MIEHLFCSSHQSEADERTIQDVWSPPRNSSLLEQSHTQPPHRHKLHTRIPRSRSRRPHHRTNNRFQRCHQSPLPQRNLHAKRQSGHNQHRDPGLSPQNRPCPERIRHNSMRDVLRVNCSGQGEAVCDWNPDEVYGRSNHEGSDAGYDDGGLAF